MKKAFLITFNSHRSDTECRMEFETAIGELADRSGGHRIIKVNPDLLDEKIEEFRNVEEKFGT